MTPKHCSNKLQWDVCNSHELLYTNDTSPLQTKGVFFSQKTELYKFPDLGIAGGGWGRGIFFFTPHATRSIVPVDSPIEPSRTRRWPRRDDRPDKVPYWVLSVMVSVFPGLFATCNWYTTMFLLSHWTCRSTPSWSTWRPSNKAPSSPSTPSRSPRPPLSRR